MSNYTPTEFIDMMNLQHGAPRKFDRAICGSVSGSQIPSISSSMFL